MNWFSKSHFSFTIDLVRIKQVLASMKTNPMFYWKSRKDSKNKARSHFESSRIRSKLFEVEVLFPEQSNALFGKGDKKENKADDLFKQLRFSFILGRLLGIIPFSGIFTRPPSFKNLYFK